MKKILLPVLSMMFVISCLFALTAFASDAADITYYLVQDPSSEVAVALKEEGKTVIAPCDLYSNEFSTESYIFGADAENKNITVYLAENIDYTPAVSSNDPKKSVNSGIRIAYKSNVTFDLNGYILRLGMGVKNYTGFIIENVDAVLNIIGTRAVDENGSPIKATNETGFDAYSGFVFVYYAGGTVNCENLAVSSLEEPFYRKSDYLAGKTTLNFTNCTVDCFGSYPSISSNHNGKTAEIFLNINGGYYDGFSIKNLCGPSSIKNATIYSRDFYMDSWYDRNTMELTMENTVLEANYTYDADAIMLYATNCTFNGTVNLKGDSTGGSFAQLTDCTYKALTFDKVNGKAIVITSPTCVKGTVTVYTTENQAGVLESELEPVLPHSFVSSTSFENGNKYAGICYVTHLCSVCETAEEEEIAPIITKKGFSVPLFGTIRCILLGFEINHDALARYEAVTNTTLEYGIAVALEECLNGKNPLDENGDVTVLEQGNVIKFDATQYKTHSIVVFKINLTEEHFDTSVLMTGYIIEKDTEGNGQVTYVQESMIEDGNFLFTSYNIQASTAIN